VLPAAPMLPNGVATTSIYTTGSTQQMSAFLASVGEASQRVYLLPTGPR